MYNQSILELIRKRNEPVFYYIMVDPDKATKCKVGITKNPKQRLKAYKTAAPSCFFRKVYDNIPKYHERNILNVLKEVARVQSEYIHFAPWLVQNIVEAYFDDNDVYYERTDD